MTELQDKFDEETYDPLAKTGWEESDEPSRQARISSLNERSDSFGNYKGDEVYTKSRGEGPFVLVEKCKVTTSKKASDGIMISTEGWIGVDKRGKTRQLIAADLTPDSPPPGRFIRGARVITYFGGQAFRGSRRYVSQGVKTGFRYAGAAIKGGIGVAKTTTRFAGSLAYRLAMMVVGILAAHGLFVFLGGVVLVLLLCFAKAVFSREAVNYGFGEPAPTPTSR